MTSLLHKKRRITRRNMLHWMQDSIRLSVGLSCLWGVSSLGLAADTSVPKPRSSQVVGRAAVDQSVAATRPGLGSASKITRTTRHVIRAQNPFEETTIEASSDVIPPPEPPKSSPPAPEADALKRLLDRSAKARWDQLHQEWLKARKNRNAAPDATRQQSPAAEQPAGTSAGPENPFEAETAAPGTSPETESPTTDNAEPPSGDGARRPAVPSRPVYLQAQPKNRDQLPTEEELNKLLNDDNGQRLPPPVRDPSLLPKITDIQPLPEERAEPAGTRPIPEQDPKSYVQIGGRNQFTPRSFPEFTYSFEATNVFSNPLYFEDAPLERYGHRLPGLIQPIASVARFGTQVVFMPYQMTVKPLNTKIYPLGWYTPGDCVPYRLYKPGYNLKAAAVQTATILGFSYALP